MISTLDQNIQELGNGKIILLDSGTTIFKLDSFKENPIVKPQDLEPILKKMIMDFEEMNFIEWV